MAIRRSGATCQPECPIGALPVQPGAPNGQYVFHVTKEPCEGDANGDETVDVQDLLLVILLWGPCDGACDADLNGDNVVDVLDLLAVILGWGGC